MKVLGLIVCFLCVNFSVASERYTAGVLQLQNKEEINSFTPFIYEAGKKNVDILVLPLMESSGASDNYDETIKAISSAAKQAGLYVVTHLYEKTRCHLGDEMIRTNLVFDREGAIVAVKPLNGIANCTALTSDLVTFTTDFGVTFGVLMDEDIVLQDLEHMRGLKNFVMTGGSNYEIPFLAASQFPSSWSYATNANLVSSTGVYSGKGGLKTGSDNLAVVELHKNGGNDQLAVPSVDSLSTNLCAEDQSQCVIKALDLAASLRGYKDTVCHKSFCCEFYIKTSVTDPGTTPEAYYSLAAFNGVYPFSSNYNIGAQNCALCSGSKNNKTILFKRISISANFTKQNAAYPIVQATVLPLENFKFDTKTDGVSKEVKLEVVDSENINNLGIFIRNYAKDSVTYPGFADNSTETSGIYDLVFNKDVQEFFDYVWIRLRVLILVVSIYILEMM